MKNDSFARISIFIAMVFIILFSGCSDKKETVSITVGKNTYQVEVARTREEQTEGLMFRESIKPNEGMIFIYNEDRKLSFWMKNTFIPLSIAYISKDGIIKEIYSMNPESLIPVKSIHSVRYAMELPLGAFEKSGAGVGDTIILPAEITDN
ncbi:MAG: DUF192 domain-containing protein [Spirochaetales bacterium]|nr:DUF192 domain-containing protein [Spirochaetales bacterium]